MPKVGEFRSVFQNRKVLVTGHTGFKGAWLTAWLRKLGADVLGFSLPLDGSERLFQALNEAGRSNDRFGDIRNRENINRAVEEFEPDFVFHLAAQSLVRQSYANPVETYEVNVLGSIHLAEALRRIEKNCTAVFVTSDKCYENREWVHGYRETDALGGHDPYSSSKGAMEIAVASWRRSFFRDHPVRIATARAGNVIGGGDWAEDRIVPDCMRALRNGTPIQVRNPIARRPWQHVLEPLSGYLSLAAGLSRAAGNEIAALASAFNFGPHAEACRPVKVLVEEILKHWPGSWIDQSDPNAPHEATLLHLNADKAFSLLGWKPNWSFENGVEKTTTWYRAEANSESVKDLTLTQIEDFEGTFFESPPQS